MIAQDDQQLDQGEQEDDQTRSTIASGLGEMSRSRGCARVVAGLNIDVGSV